MAIRCHPLPTFPATLHFSPPQIAEQIDAPKSRPAGVLVVGLRGDLLRKL